MKTILKSVLLASFCLLVLGCSEEKLEEEFFDPNEITEANIPFIFTGTLQQPHLFRSDYAPLFHEYRQINKVTGIGIYPFFWASSGEWIVINDWSGPSFHRQLFEKGALDFNKGLNKIQLLYDAMSDEEKAQNEIYIQLSTIVRAYGFQRMTDAYDDVPFSEAGSGNEGVFYPKFDTQEFIYNSILDNLKATVTTLKSLNLSSENQAILSKQDIINGGDLNKWIKFANSLRLRMAMRLSVVSPSKTQEVLTELNTESLVTESTDIIGIAEVDPVRFGTGGDGGRFPRGFHERGWDMWAPKFIMEDIFNYHQVQDFTVDPRTYVVFQPATDGRYIPLPHFEKDEAQTYLEQFLSVEDAKDIIDGNHGPSNASWGADEQLASKYNRVTYLNFKNVWPIFTPSETHLLLAEAAVRFPGSVSTPAADSYERALSLSIDWYYEQHTTNTQSEGSTPPLEHVNPEYHVTKDDAHISAFVSSKSGAFTTLSTDEMIVEIFNQKLAHLNIYDTFEIWSESRRLMKDHGQLLHPVEGKVEWLERLFYAPAEARDNPNYKTVAGQDNTTTPVWWTGRK